MPPAKDSQKDLTESELDRMLKLARKVKARRRRRRLTWLRIAQMMGDE